MSRVVVLASFYASLHFFFINRFNHLRAWLVFINENRYLVRGSCWLGLRPASCKLSCRVLLLFGDNLFVYVCVTFVLENKSVSLKGFHITPCVF